MKILLTLLAVVVCYLPAPSQRVSLQSPDGILRYTFLVTKGAAFYCITRGKDSLVLPSSISMKLGGRVFGDEVKMGKVQQSRGVEDYFLLAGRKKHVIDRYREVLITLSDRDAGKVNLRIRAFDAAVAFRYEFPENVEQDTLVLNDERTEIRLAGNPNIKALDLPNFTSSHEGPYSDRKYNDLKPGQLMDLPTLVQWSSAKFLAITEAALVDHAGMYLMKSGGALYSKLSPWPTDSNIIVKASLPHVSPWRVFMASDRIGTFLETTVLTSLNAPCAIPDTTWIRPGKTTFPWWNGNIVPDTLNAPGNNFVTQQYYIDFCARNKIDYHTVVEYGLHQWYTDDGVGFQPGPHNDVTKPVPGLDMKEVCDYAHSKGVGVRVWVHWAALYPRLDSAFAIFERWRLSGMMVDFMDRDDQQMVNIQEEMLRKAASHHLHIQFHGAYKPTGWNRTWPNELTREGAMNYEHNKWSDEGITPDHDLDIIFTRMIAGATDYHMGGFRAVPPEKFHAQYSRPLMQGTRAHQLGMYVVLEDYLGMVCDYPAAYEGQPGFDFVRQVPTTWDDTRVLAANVDEYALIARQKNDAWYLGGINNHEARSLSLPLNFLNTGNYTMKIYRDGQHVKTDANDLAIETLTVHSGDVLNIALAAGGGVAAVFEKQ